MSQERRLWNTLCRIKPITLFLQLRYIFNNLIGFDIEYHQRVFIQIHVQYFNNTIIKLHAMILTIT